MRNAVIFFLLSIFIAGCADAIGISEEPANYNSVETFSPVGRIMKTPQVDNVPLIGPPSTDLW